MKLTVRFLLKTNENNAVSILSHRVINSYLTYKTITKTDQKYKYNLQNSVNYTKTRK